MELKGPPNAALNTHSPSVLTLCYTAVLTPLPRLPHHSALPLRKSFFPTILSPTEHFCKTTSYSSPVNTLVCPWLSMLLSLDMSHEEEGISLSYEECPHEWETEKKEKRNKFWISPSQSCIQTSRHPDEKKLKLRGMKGFFNLMKQSQRYGKMPQ